MMFRSIEARYLISRNLNKSVTLRLKVKPEDFIAEEIANIPIKKEGVFCAYLLKKRGWNTVDLIKKLSTDFHIPFSDFSYGGRKDRYALTTQYITIARRRCNQIAQINSLQFPQPSFAKEALGVSNKGRLRGICEKNSSLDFAGRMDRPMGPDLIIGNRFEITIRSLTKNNLKFALSEIDAIKKYGYPNYFNDQRFGSFDPRQGFIAEKILRKHYNGALKIYLTHIRPEASKEKK